MDARSLRDDVAMKDATREDVQGERRHATEDDDAIAEDTARSSIFESGRRHFPSDELWKTGDGTLIE
jgi:hypothetical protein